MFKTNLPDNFLDMSEPEKLLLYAENYQESFDFENEPDSYFVKAGTEHDRHIPDIMEYDFSYFPGISKAFSKVFNSSNAGDFQLLLRILAGALLKNKPRDVGVFTPKCENTPDPALRQRKDDDGKIPDFYYPM